MCRLELPGVHTGLRLLGIYSIAFSAAPQRPLVSQNTFMHSQTWCLRCKNHYTAHTTWCCHMLLFSDGKIFASKNPSPTEVCFNKNLFPTKSSNKNLCKILSNQKNFIDKNSVAFGSAPRREADSQPISQLVRQAVSQTVGRASRQADRNTQFGFFQWQTRLQAGRAVSDQAMVER